LNQITLHINSYFSKLPLKSVRFFGKIYGVHNNYYIVETDPIPPVTDQEKAKVQQEEAQLEKFEGDLETPPPPPPQLLGPPPTEGQNTSHSSSKLVISSYSYHPSIHSPPLFRARTV
jgi:hypothetical protein